MLPVSIQDNMLFGTPPLPSPREGREVYAYISDHYLMGGVRRTGSFTKLKVVVIENVVKLCAGTWCNVVLPYMAINYWQLAKS